MSGLERRVGLMVTDWRAQLFGLSLVWILLAALHADSDGLWFQGDAPRHAANGIFLQDFMSEPTWSARQYALSYYVRYPVINPVSYPPLFYLLEAGSYTLFGRAPESAKLVVLAFQWLGMFYCWRWLRDWVGSASGWGAALWLGAPASVLWSNTIVLNGPSAAMTMMILYYGRKWLAGLDQTWHRSATLTLVTLLLGVGIYYHTAVALLVLICWVPVVVVPSGRRTQLLRWMLLALVLAAIGLWIGWKWSRIGAGWSTDAWGQMSFARRWLFYIQQSGRLFGPAICVLTLVAWLGGTSAGVGPWRREARITAVWYAVVWFALTVIPAREIRYGTLLLPPIVLAAATGAAYLVHLFARSASAEQPVGGSRDLARWGIVTAVILAVTASTWTTGVPRVTGLRHATHDIVRRVGSEPVLYDGYFNGIFTYYVLAEDSDRSSHVLLGNKSFYTYAQTAGWRPRSFVTDAPSVIDRLQHELGCRWLAIESSRYSRDAPEMRLIRQVVQGPEFELVASYPLNGLGAERVELFRLRLPVEPQQEWSIPFQSLGENAQLRARPLPSRVGRSAPR